MMRTFQVLFALSTLGLFLGIMAWHVPSPDLLIVLAIAFAGAAADFFLSLRGRGK